MSRFQVYTVHINPALAHPYEEAQFIEEGFNWKAFLFAGVWALYKRLWLLALISFAFNGFVGVLALKGLNHAFAVALHLAWHCVVGFIGNDFQRAKFRKQGYIIADIVTGDSLLRAEQRFFDRYFAAHTAVA